MKLTTSFHWWSCYNIKTCMHFIPKLCAWQDTTFRQWESYYLSVIIWARACRSRLRKRDFHGAELEIPTRNHCNDRNRTKNNRSLWTLTTHCITVTAPIPGNWKSHRKKSVKWSTQNTCTCIIKVHYFAKI